MYARVTVGRSFQTSLKVEEEGAATLTFTSNPKTETAHDSNMARSTEVNEFRTKVDRNQQELRRQLSQKLREAGESQSHRHSDASTLLQQALNPTPSPLEPRNSNRRSYPGTAIGINSHYESANDVIASAQNMIKNEYGRIEQLIGDSGREIGDAQHGRATENWEQERKDVEVKLENGRRIAVRKVRKTLGGESALEADQANGKEGVEEGVEGEEDGINEDLRNSLGYAERGVRRMVKMLPKDDPKEN